MNNICPVCGKRKREKGRQRDDGTIWYRPTCRMCRNANRKPDKEKGKIALLNKIKLLERYKKAMEVLCERQCVDIDDVLKKYAPPKD